MTNYFQSKDETEATEVSLSLSLYVLLQYYNSSANDQRLRRHRTPFTNTSLSLFFVRFVSFFTMSNAQKTFRNFINYTKWIWNEEWKKREGEKRGRMRMRGEKSDETKISDNSSNNNDGMKKKKKIELCLFNSMYIYREIKTYIFIIGWSLDRRTTSRKTTTENERREGMWWRQRENVSSPRFGLPTFCIYNNNESTKRSRITTPISYSLRKVVLLNVDVARHSACRQKSVITNKAQILVSSNTLKENAGPKMLNNINSNNNNIM